MLRKALARLLQPSAARAFATQAEVPIISGVPPLQQGRRVTIYSPARTAGQQGISQTAAGEGPAVLPAGCRCPPMCSFLHKQIVNT